LFLCAASNAVDGMGYLFDRGGSAGSISRLLGDAFSHLLNGRGNL
jgi:hypothetical protein